MTETGWMWALLCLVVVIVGSLHEQVAKLQKFMEGHDAMPELVQIHNPRGYWVLIDRAKGSIIGHGTEPFVGIKTADLHAEYGVPKGDQHG